MSDAGKKIKGHKWDPSEYHTGTRVTVVAKRSSMDIDDHHDGMGSVIQIGCNTIPVSLVTGAGGRVGKKKVSVPATLTSNNRLFIENGEMFGHGGWHAEQINDYAHHVIIVSAPTEEPPKIERYVMPGLWQCTNHNRRHGWVITAKGEWVSILPGYTQRGLMPEPDCHPDLVSTLTRLADLPEDPIPVKVEVYERASCCMLDMATSLPKDHPDRKERSSSRGLADLRYADLRYVPPVA